jgi:iron-sulfur cluster assembly protein
MLAITPTAVEAIQGLTSQPGVPDGAGVKLSPQPTPEGTTIELSLAEGPEESDQVLEADKARVFVAEPLAPVLDDKILDANVEGEQVSFTLIKQSPDENI